MIEPLLKSTGALLTGHFRLSSGLHSPNYVQCARLLENPDDALAIGRALAEELEGLGVERVVAPALGGVVIGFTVAAALHVPMIFTERKDGVMTLRRGFTIDTARRVVIVEDVVTTGKSTRETAEVVRSAGGEVVAYASILNRSGSDAPFDAPYRALLAMELATSEEKDCAACAAGMALDAPGSRFSGGVR